MGFWKQMGFMWRSWTSEATTVISNPVRDSQFQIEDAEKECSRFESRIAQLIASNNGTKRKLEEEQNEVKKWKSIAEKAAADGNEADARIALATQIEAENRIKQLKADYDAAKTEAENLKQQLDEYHGKIENAKNNNARFAARLEGANIKQSISSSKSNLKSAFSSLDDLEKEANKAVDLAGAYTELGTNDKEDLSNKYSGTDTNLEDRLSKLMAKK